MLCDPTVCIKLLNITTIGLQTQVTDNLTLQLTNCSCLVFLPVIEPERLWFSLSDECSSFSTGLTTKRNWMPQTGNDNLIWHFCSKYDYEVRVMSTSRSNNWRQLINFTRHKWKYSKKVHSIGLWICLPWDFFASSSDSELVLITVSRRAKSWDLGGLQFAVL